MKLKNILKRLNRRIQRNLNLPYLSKVTGMAKEDCLKERFALTRNFSFLKKYSTSFRPLYYNAGLMTAEEGGDYSHIRFHFGREWYEYVDIYHHRGFLFDDGIRRTPESWGITNMDTNDWAEFDTLEALKAYIEENCERYNLQLV